MDIDVFQLLPRRRAAPDREVVERHCGKSISRSGTALRACGGPGTTFSGYGSTGVRCVYATGIARAFRLPKLLRGNNARSVAFTHFSDQQSAFGSKIYWHQVCF